MPGGAVVNWPRRRLLRVLRGRSVDHRLRTEEPAAGWVRAALAGSEVLDDSGRILRRASGAIFLSGAGAPSGPLRRRAELAALAQEVDQAEASLAHADGALRFTVERLAERENTLTDTVAAAERARDAERQALATRDDVIRVVANLAREAADSEALLEQMTERVGRSEQRLAAIDAALVQGEMSRGRVEQELGSSRSELAELEADQENAREQRAHWQVQEAHVAGSLRGATERLERAGRTRAEAEERVRGLIEELTRLDADAASVAAQQAEWLEARAERRVALQELEVASSAAEGIMRIPLPPPPAAALSITG